MSTVYKNIGNLYFIFSKSDVSRSHTYIEKDHLFTSFLILILSKNMYLRIKKHKGDGRGQV